MNNENLHFPPIPKDDVDEGVSVLLICRIFYLVSSFNCGLEKMTMISHFQLKCKLFLKGSV